MGLWDRFRPHAADEEPTDVGQLADDATDPGHDWFHPGLGVPYEGPDGETLVFTGTRAVLHRPGRADLSGEYTSSGRFTAVAPFERPVVFTALAPAPGETDGFTARRTDTADASSIETTYRAQAHDPA